MSPKKNTNFREQSVSEVGEPKENEKMMQKTNTTADGGGRRWPRNARAMSPECAGAATSNEFKRPSSRNIEINF